MGKLLGISESRLLTKFKGSFCPNFFPRCIFSCHSNFSCSFWCCFVMADSAAASYKNYASSTRTGFPHGIDFDKGDYDIDLTWGEEDLVVVKKKGGKKTEVHILSSASGYQKFTMHAQTGLHETGNDWTFLVAKNRDLVCINRNASGKTDVHILSASSGYKDFKLHIVTCLHSTAWPSWHFSIADNNDIYVVAAPGGSGNLELHILDAKTNYTTFKHHQNCNIKVSTDWAWWSVAKNESRSLIAVVRQGNGNPTEVHIRPKPYTNWSCETQTVAPCTEDKKRFRFALASSNDVGILGCEDGSSLKLSLLSAGNQISTATKSGGSTKGKFEIYSKSREPDTKVVMEKQKIRGVRVDVPVGYTRAKSIKIFLHYVNPAKVAVNVVRNYIAVAVASAISVTTVEMWIDTPAVAWSTFHAKLSTFFTSVAVQELGYAIVKEIILSFNYSMVTSTGKWKRRT